MDDALGVNHDFDVVVIQPEEVVGFDHLQPLVHQGGGIHGDLAAHAPVGMGGGIGHGGIFEVGCGPVTEGAAGGGELNAPQTRSWYTGGEAGVFSPGRSLQALEDGRVFGICRQQPAPTFLELGQHHRACCDQGFLVGQGQILTGADGRQGGQQAGAAHDPCYHEIGCVPGGGHVQSAGTTHELGLAFRLVFSRQSLEALLQFWEQRFISQGDQLGAVALDLLHEQREISARREGNNPELFRKAFNNVESLCAD